MSKQKFKKGDFVRVAVNLGPTMSHFDAGMDAVVIGSYRDQYGGGGQHQYTICYADSTGTSWYNESQLTKLPQSGARRALAGWRKLWSKRGSDATKVNWILQGVL